MLQSPMLDAERSALPGRPPGAIETVTRARKAGRARGVAVGLALAVAVVVTFAVSVSVGDFPISISEVIPAIFGFGNPDSHFIIRTLRLPRAMTAVLVGAAFAFSGAIFQSLARNPLASPDIIGITAGASAAAVFIIVVVGGGGWLIPLGAFLGALSTATMIYFLAYRRGISAYRLVLVGIGIAAVLNSVIWYLLTRAQIWEAQRATIWLTGSLNGRGWEHVRPVGLTMLTLFPAVLLLARPLRILQLGDDAAKGLGAGVEKFRRYLLLVAVALSALATASAGPVAFVAFVAPPIARRLTNSSLTLVPAALAGALLLLVSDLMARRAFAPTELSVGIITGLIGAPYLLWLLARANKVGSGG